MVIKSPLSTFLVEVEGISLCGKRTSLAQMVKHLPNNVGDLGSIPGSGKSPGEGNGNQLQCSSLENPMDGGGWLQSTEYSPWGRKESETTEGLHFTHFFIC